MMQRFLKMLSAVAMLGGSACMAQGLSGLEFQHVTFSVRNLDQEVAWYEKVFGLKQFDSTHRKDGSGVKLHGGAMRVDLIQYVGSSRPPALNPPFLQQGEIHIAFTVADFPAAVAWFKAMNVSVQIDPKRPILQVHDPEGNEIELAATGA